VKSPNIYDMHGGFSPNWCHCSAAWQNDQKVRGNSGQRQRGAVPCVSSNRLFIILTALVDNFLSVLNHCVELNNWVSRIFPNGHFPSNPKADCIFPPTVKLRHSSTACRWVEILGSF